jgi:hypothetical protein
MKITIEANSGTYTAYLTARDQIVLYSTDEDCPLAILSPRVKRKPTLDVSADGIVSVVREWLEAAVDRLEIETITAWLTPPGRMA